MGNSRRSFVLCVTVAVATIMAASARLPGQAPPYRLGVKKYPWASPSAVLAIDAPAVAAASPADYVAHADSLLRTLAPVLDLDASLADLQLLRARDIGVLGFEVEFQQRVASLKVKDSGIRVLFLTDGRPHHVTVDYYPPARAVESVLFPPAPKLLGAIDAGLRLWGEQTRRSPSQIPPADAVLAASHPGDIESAIYPGERGVRPAIRASLRVAQNTLTFWIDAESHEVLSVDEDTLGCVNREEPSVPTLVAATGCGQVNDPFPGLTLSFPYTTALRDVPLFDLLESGHLESAYLAVQASRLNWYEPGQQFKWAQVTNPPPLPGFAGQLIAQVDLYYHATRAFAFLNACGFGHVMDLQMPMYIDSSLSYPCPSISPGCYVTSTRAVHFQTSNAAQESDLVRHEYGHAVAHAIRFPAIPFSGYASFGLGDMGAGIAEALADCADALFQDDPQLHTYGLIERDADSAAVQPDQFVSGDAHSSGQIFAGAIWDLRLRVGKLRAQTLAHALIYFVSPNSTFDQALDQALIPADYALYGGVHEDVIRQCFAIHGINGAAGSYAWPATPLPASARPYPDTIDQTLSHSIPGAPAIRVTFDEHTKAWEDHTPDFLGGPLPSDAIEIRDSSGSQITGSPFRGRALAGATVTVPGDTVNVRLVSIPGDNRRAAGYRVLAASDASLPNIPPVAEFSITPKTTDAPQTHRPYPVTLDAGASHDTDGSILLYAFEFGDGSPPVITRTPTTSHVFTRVYTPGRITVALTVTDDRGARTTTKKTLRFFDTPMNLPQPPTGQGVLVEARFSSNTIHPTIPQWRIAHQNTSTAPIANIRLDFIMQASPAIPTGAQIWWGINSGPNGTPGIIYQMSAGNSVTPTCHGLYRNGTDAACGLDYPATPLSPCNAFARQGFQASVLDTNGFNRAAVIEFPFVGGLFQNRAFEFDSRVFFTTPGSASGVDSAGTLVGMRVFVTLQDGTLLWGTLQTDPADPHRAFVQF